MAFFAGHGFADAERPECHPLIEFHAVAYYRCFTDDHTSTVVDAKVTANGRAGVNVDTGFAVGKLCY